MAKRGTPARKKAVSNSSRARIIRVPVPKGRDPFINTPLISLGKGPGGAERFWISTWNACSGTLAALVDEAGKCRIYRFGRQHPGFYSAVQEDEDTLWLCGDLARVVRLSITSGKFEEFPTGAPSALVFQGMALDRDTGMLFAAAFPPPKTVGFAFDTRTRKGVKVFDDMCEAKYMRFSFANGDGTWSFVMHLPETLVRWDPRTQTIESMPLKDRDAHASEGGSTYLLVADDAGRRYFPGVGWFNPAGRSFEDGPRPSREMTWFAHRGRQAWGCQGQAGAMDVATWDLSTGEVRNICSVPDATQFNLAVSQSGKIVAVNMYGEFARFDGQTGALEMSKRLPSDSIGVVDCVQRIDKDRVLGTPFITQRFWEANIRTSKGFDCGRAAPGGGEILRTWKIGKKVYMAAYTGGELVEYDPSEHPHFPENPRVVAKAPGGMRPVAHADDGRNIFYACSAHYGHLGSVVARYDTKTGEAAYRGHPLPDQQISSLFYDRKTRSLMAGSTFNADCQSATPSTRTCYLARLDAKDLSVIEKVAAPEGTTQPNIVGPLSPGRFLCICIGIAGGTRMFALNSARLEVPPAELMRTVPGRWPFCVYAGTPGFFVVREEERLELWDMRKFIRVKVLAEGFTGRRAFVQEGVIYAVESKELLVLEGRLKGLR